MARTFGRMFGSTWDDDDDFLALGADAKYVYSFLVAQLDLGHSGIITLRIAPWARRLSKSAAEVADALDELHGERFVVLDDEEMLLLVRSLIRRDKVYLQPNVFKSAADQIYRTPSKPIRRALLAELERLDPEEMKGDTAKVCGELIAWLRKTSENPSPNPSGKGSAKGSAEGSFEGSAKGSEDPSGTDSDMETPEPSTSEALANIEPGDKGSANPNGNPPSRVRARACLSPSSFSHTQTPLTSGIAEGETDAATPRGANETDEDERPAKPDLNAGRADVDALCSRLAELIIANGSKPPTVTKAWRDAARLLLDKDHRELDKALRLVEWSQNHRFWKTNVLSMPTFREKYDQLRLQANEEWERGQGGTVLPFRRQNDDLGGDAHMERYLQRAAARQASGGDVW